MMYVPKQRHTLWYADGHGPTYTYTLDGKLATRTWARTDANANPLTTTYSYDSATGELIGIDYADATPDIAYTYTRAGQPATVTDVVGTMRLRIPARAAISRLQEKP